MRIETKRRLARAVVKWRVEYSIAALVLYLAAIPVTIVVFPDSNLWIALLILFPPIVAQVKDIGDTLNDEIGDA